jgi:uncharacterized DUF497 family protein
MEFDWDDGNAAKATNHGLNQEVIEGFFRLRPRVSPDPAHSVAEQRFIAVGPTPEGRMAFAAFCWRDGKVRPISARYMHTKEARRHDESARHPESPGDDDR